MKRRLVIIVMGIAVTLGLGVYHAQANLEVSADVEIHQSADFYGPLGGYGEWVEVSSYGRCWRPARAEVDWRPYCYGHWVWTDCGWYWASDEPWAWACYHYGGWVYESSYGWIWVPGVEWAPAWVCWREGGGYIGWAPLPPRRVGHAEVIVDASVNVAPSLFVFVDTGRFHDPVSPKSVIINKTTIIDKTVNITKIRQVEKNVGNGGPKKVVFNDGPPVQAIEKATGRKIEPVPVQQVHDLTPPPRELKQKQIEKQEKAAPPPQERAVPREKVEPREKAEPAPRERAEPREKVEPREKAEPAPQERSEPRERVEPTPEPREKAEPRERVEPAPRHREKVEPAPGEKEGPREKAEPREGAGPREKKGEERGQ